MHFFILYIFLFLNAITIAAGMNPPKLSSLPKQHLQSTGNVPHRLSSKNGNKKEMAETIVAVNNKQAHTLNAFDLCICGAIATALGDFCMHPVDTIKIMQQTSVHAKGVIETARLIFAKSGVVGFYPGVLPYMTADGVSGAIKFATFELSKRFAESRIAPRWHSVAQFVCAAGAMLASSVTLVPGEVLKTRLQAGAIKNLGQGIADILKQDGVAGLFAGYGATLLRDVPYTMLELGLYENIKTFLRKVRNSEELSQADELCAAAVTGGITAFLTTPLDLIKTRLMMQSTTAVGQYSGVGDALHRIYEAGGMTALFAGAAARVAWLVPFTTIYLGIYEVLKKSILQFKAKGLE